MNVKMRTTKILLGIMCILFILPSGFSQNNPEELDLFITAFGKEKKTLTREFMNLDPVYMQDFWKLFDEYEIQRKELAKKRWILLNQYIARIESMSEEQADDIMKQIIKHSETTNKLIKKYYKKIGKATNPKVAAQFYQLEHYLLSGIRLEILSLVPFIGELD
jgi:hypothetical protein